jgi:phage tail tape-measure protein
MATGSALGAAAGPAGVIAGAVVGGVIGGLAGKKAGEEINPTVEDAYWRQPPCCVSTGSHEFRCLHVSSRFIST